VLSGIILSSIQKGLMVLVGISVEDTPECADWMAKKLLAGDFPSNPIA
jgi:D-Tyr-tRNAtyr deacylase